MGRGERERNTVICTKVDPEVLRSGKGLEQAMREASSSRHTQAFFEQKAEDRRLAAELKKQERRNEHRQAV